jgi:hypothetical protein
LFAERLLYTKPWQLFQFLKDPTMHELLSATAGRVTRYLQTASLSRNSSGWQIMVMCQLRRQF